MKRSLSFIFLLSILLCLDTYVYWGIHSIPCLAQSSNGLIFDWIYWCLSGFTLSILLYAIWFRSGFEHRLFKIGFLPVFCIQYLAKLFFSCFLLVDDLIRFLRWSLYKFQALFTANLANNPVIPRSDWLVNAGIIALGIPLLTMSYGILAGAHDYRIRRVKVKLPHLPAGFHGFKIGQLSDIHSGSFFNSSAVKRGVAMLLGEQPDIIFFTGDLVNNKASELNDYFAIFSQIKAPLGVYATLGNHDYGDYITWPSAQAKAQNLRDIQQAHALLGWQLLINEHQLITIGGDQLAVIGIENWGTGGFAKYGQLAQAYQGTQDVPVKLLLSHDPSHWDAEIRPQFQDIDLTFAGHTHGFQFGIEFGSFQWSPVQYRYKQWAGLYQTGNQYLYVNRGFGYIGYPGRIGILPELTLLELEKS